MEKIIWGSIPIIGLEDMDFSKYSLSKLAKIENGKKRGAEAVKSGHLKEISKKGAKVPKPEGFGAKCAERSRGVVFSESRKNKIREKRKAYKKPIEETLENPKAKIILEHLKKGTGVNEIIRQAKCSNGFFYKIKKYYDENLK
jgi:hypothetical protein